MARFPLPQNDADEPLEVPVAVPQAEGIPRTLVQTGSIVATESAKIFSKVSGYVESVLVDIGASVDAGDVLARINVPDLKQDLLRAQARLSKSQAEAKRVQAQLRVIQADKQTAQAELEQARADIARFVSERELREKELARLKGLSDRGSIEAKILDEKQARLEQAQAAEQHARKAVEVARARQTAIDAKIELAQAEVATAQAAVQIAEADLQQARVTYDFAEITAPFSGIVTSRNCDLGDFIREASRGSSEPLFTIAQTDRMRVVVSIPDRMVPFIRPGDQAEIRIDALYGDVFSGTVARISMRQDRQTRSMRAEIDLPNPAGRFIDGMYGSVTIVSRPPEDVMTVPAAALIGEIQDGFGRLRVVREGRIKNILTRIGLLQDGLVELLGEVDQEDLVVLNHDPAFIDGRLVDVVLPDELNTEIAGSYHSE